ncbi:hypothetical protein BRADI_3g00741v3 [Brachypodium distachyon]|uniref:NB-ARC domain-containing protein n=1 Tax=Brachypodium distachyon TaxID=15368 RepID=A0A0Q3LJZ6_BRADI|nr:hypothetical protein BRADI_3g00741v3 [Brachypodium distachyon]
MAGIMVSASTGAMNSLLGKLATLMGEEFARLKNLRKQVKFITDELMDMKDALERLADVDELDPQTKRWRNTLREISYDIEDIVDDFMQKIGGKYKKSWFVRKTIRRLKTLRFLTALYENTASLVGVEGPADELADLLKDEDNQLKVVSIVGFGGLGKTTLANVVYGRLKGEFNCCAFVPVSQKPDIPKLLCSLLSQLGIRPYSHDCELNVLLGNLREHLQNKSRVIVTTRIQEVATTCCSNRHDYILQMKPLSNEESRRLFFDRIFGSEQTCPQQLKEVSAEILKKCGGLPLAIISISSMLASEGSNQKERWKHVRDSMGSGANLTLDGVRQILNYSYKDLPPHLKTYLLYLGMYPEDYTIKRTDLERQWMAEGFISKGHGQDVEKVAGNYFNELVNRSLIQPVRFDDRGSVTHCRVHDMMLDLILLKSAEESPPAVYPPSAQENFFTIVNDPQDFAGLQYKVRRLSIRFDGATARKNGQTIIPKNTSVSQVRSVMFFGSSENTPPLSEFKFLRVFFTGLARSAAVDLSGLCKLYQLRYLSISYGWSYQLPTHIRVLQHLQSLEVPFCDSIPSDMVHLPHLMHLVAYCRLPDEIRNLKSLRYLSSFVLNLNTLDNFNGLGELTNLRYLDLRQNLGDDKEKRMDALCSSLGRLCNLEELYAELDGCIDGLMPLFSPSTPCRLERFYHTEGSWFSRVPSWMGELRNLIYLCSKVGELLADGVGILAELPALTHLDIMIRHDTKEMIVIYGGGAFLALKRFDLVLSSPWHLMFQAGVMPKLQRLVLWYNNGSGSEQNGAGPAGIEHLSALEELSAKIACEGATESEKASAESALRSAINMHPNHPRVLVRVFDLKFAFCQV